MADVYLAKHPRLPRRDALKVLTEGTTADPEFRERFNREADLAATLWHPHIVAVHDRGEFDGHLWIAMDYVEGTDAARLMRERFRGGMSEHDVLCDRHRGRRRTRLCPCSRAAAPRRQTRQHPAHPSRRGRPSNPVGGLRRSPPTRRHQRNHRNQRRGGHRRLRRPRATVGSNIDGRADQYALAASAFHLLTGAPPYRHSNPVAVIGQHLHADRPGSATTAPIWPTSMRCFSRPSQGSRGQIRRCRQFAAAFSEHVSDPRRRSRHQVGALGATSRPPPRRLQESRQRFTLKAGIAVAMIVTLCCR